MSKIIEVVNLYKKYKQSTHFALKDLSFSVEKGEIFGMLGTNGAGKTTLMSILMGEMTPTAGEFSICGLSFKGESLLFCQSLWSSGETLAKYCFSRT